MNWKKELKIPLGFLALFVFAYPHPLETDGFTSSILQSLALIKWSAREQGLLCRVRGL